MVALPPSYHPLRMETPFAGCSLDSAEHTANVENFRQKVGTACPKNSGVLIRVLSNSEVGGVRMIITRKLTSGEGQAQFRGRR